jgi:hypothetical protein
MENIVENMVFNFRNNNTQIEKEYQCVLFYNRKEINTIFNSINLGISSLTNFDVEFLEIISDKNNLEYEI